MLREGINFFNRFSAEQRYIVAYAMPLYHLHREKNLSQNEFIKRYKWLNSPSEALCEMFHELEKLFVNLTFRRIQRSLVPKLCVR